MFYTCFNKYLTKTNDNWIKSIKNLIYIILVIINIK